MKINLRRSKEEHINAYKEKETFQIVTQAEMDKINANNRVYPHLIMSPGIIVGGEPYQRRLRTSSTGPR